MEKDRELLRLTRENNRILKQIIAYINHIASNADNENNYDFVRNVIANLVSSSLPNLRRVR